MQYSDFQNQPSSEKITLAILSASKRLMGWVVHSGSVYKITGVEFAVIDSISESGAGYTEVSSIGSVTASKYYLDRSTQTLYIRTAGSVNPNGVIVVATFNFHFANVPIILPHDLDTGFDVQFEPMIQSTSEFGVTIDTVAQTSEALEGTGTLSFNNDFDFWPKYFDKLSFENQRCHIYSFNRGLAPQNARIIFKGTVATKSYDKTTVSFQLQDQFATLRSPVDLNVIASLGGRTDDTLSKAYQRMILGKVYGHVPTNIDQVVTGYPITGTVSINVNGLTVTGSGTAFLAELSPNDKLILNGVQYSIASISTNTSLTLSTVYIEPVNISGAAITAVPDQPKRYMNRVHNVAGHALREPSTTTLDGCTILILMVASTRDISDGDTIYIGTLGSGELAIVDKVIGDNYIRLSTSLSTSPALGTTVTRPAIQNVRIENLKLVYYTDYRFNATTSTLTLLSTAESNSAPTLQLSTNLSFTSGSRVVTGTGLQSNQSPILPGCMVGIVGNAIFAEVLSIDSDTQLTLRAVSTFTSTGLARIKPFIFDPGSMTITMDALGRTDDGTTGGILIKTAPAISKILLEDAGLASEINTDAFTAAEDLAYQEIGVVVPTAFSDTSVPIYRDVMNMVNVSVFGTLVQNADFEFEYEVLRPKKTSTAPRYSESDILSFTLNATADYVVKTVTLNYRPKEYDYLTKNSSVQTIDKTSDNATYVVQTTRTKTLDTNLSNDTDADIIAARWSFLLASSTGRLTLTTKMQGMSLQIGDIVEIEHRKFFERHGSSGKRKLVLIESAKKLGNEVHIEATDLSNAFNRVAAINEFTDVWTTASEDDKLYGGYYTDSYGLINNDPESFEINLIW